MPKTPYELWTGRKPDLGYLRVYGSVAMVHVPEVNRKKWDQKSVKHTLVGYDETTKGYRCFNPVNRRVVVSCDVTIIERPKQIIADESQEKHSPEENSASVVEEHELF